jgi:hypothetical protein
MIRATVCLDRADLDLIADGDIVLASNPSGLLYTVYLDGVASPDLSLPRVNCPLSSADIADLHALGEARPHPQCHIVINAEGATR